MREKIERTLVTILAFGFWIFMFQGIDLAEAKDPDYPTKSITCYIHVSAGGTTDIAARGILDLAGRHLGQPFVPVNKPGAGGVLSAMTVMNSKPDGYNLGTYAGSATLVMPHTEECPYKDLSGHTLILNYGKYILPVIVRSDAPWKTWKEFIEWAKRNPGAVKIGTTSARSLTPMGISLWQAEQKERVQFAYLVYKGGSESLSALLGGHITLDATSMDVPRAQYLKEGKIRILAYLSKEKATGYEESSSFQELYGFEPPNLMGIWGPKGIPEYVLEKLEDAFTKAAREPEFVNMMNRMYTPVVYMNRAEVNKYVEGMYPKVGEIVKILRAEEAKEKK